MGLSQSAPESGIHYVDGGEFLVFVFLCFLFGWIMGEGFHRGDESYTAYMCTTIHSAYVCTTYIHLTYTQHMLDPHELCST